MKNQTNLLSGVIRFLIILVSLNCVYTGLGNTYFFPDSKGIITNAEVIAVCTLTNQDEVWKINIKSVIKGNCSSGDSIPISSYFPGTVFNCYEAARIVKNEDFLFLGKWDRDTRCLQPTCGFISIWPQGYLVPEIHNKTLDECIKFTQQVLSSNALTAQINSNLAATSNNFSASTNLSDATNATPNIKVAPLDTGNR